MIGVDPVEESTKIAQLHLEEDPVIVPRVKYITGKYAGIHKKHGNMEVNPHYPNRLKYWET